MAKKPKANDQGETYTVLPGDTMYSIGQKFGQPWIDIVDENADQPGIAKSFYVREGTELKIPAKFDPSGQ